MVMMSEVYDNAVRQAALGDYNYALSSIDTALGDPTIVSTEFHKKFITLRGELQQEQAHILQFKEGFLRNQETLETKFLRLNMLQLGLRGENTRLSNNLLKAFEPWFKYLQQVQSTFQEAEEARKKMRNEQLLLYKTCMEVIASNQVRKKINILFYPNN